MIESVCCTCRRRRGIGRQLVPHRDETSRYGQHIRERMAMESFIYRLAVHLRYAKGYLPDVLP